MAKQNIAPVIRVAPLGELKVYAITENELEELERGSPASLHLNFALFFWGIAISLFAALIGSTMPSTRTFTVFIVFFAVTLVTAFVFTILWVVQHRSSASLAPDSRSNAPTGDSGTAHG